MISTQAARLPRFGANREQYVLLLLYICKFLNEKTLFFKASTPLLSALPPFCPFYFGISFARSPPSPLFTCEKPGASCGEGWSRHWIPFNSHFLSDSHHWINHVLPALSLTTSEIPNRFSSHVSITLRPCPLFITNTPSHDPLICHFLTAVSVPIDLISNQLACYYWK